MRKLLMATAAIVGASLSLGMANAATVYNSDPTKPITSSVGSGSAGTLALAPGQMAIRIDLRENAYVIGSWGSADSVNGNKQSPFEILGYPRLYMEFDAMATNGLKYGLMWEIRNNGPSNNATSSVGSPGTNSGSETLFWRRDFGYFGMDNIGTLRLGQTDGPVSLLMVGTFDDVATGLFNGDINGAGVGGGGFNGVVPWWPFPDGGNIYTTTKAVYLSPSFAGFDFGVGYEPFTQSLNDGNNCSLGAPGPTGCATQTSSSNSGDLQRRRNTIDAAIRYRGNFGPAGIAANISTVQGGVVNPNAGAGIITPSGKISQFDNVSIYDGGLTATFAGLTVGGNVIWGQYNGQWAPKPDGAANSVAWVAGAKYTYGPATFGGQYFSWTYQGAIGIPTQRHDQGFAVGMTYNIAPGVAFLAEYLYGMRHQGGYDFINANYGPNNNNVQMQIVGAGFQWRW